MLRLRRLVRDLLRWPVRTLFGRLQPDLRTVRRRPGLQLGRDVSTADVDIGAVSAGRAKPVLHCGQQRGLLLRVVRMRTVR